VISYGRQKIDQEDIAAVLSVLTSDWLTCGPMVERFEHALAEKCGAAHAVAVSNGTAALHAAFQALGVGPGDEVIVPAITFAATANAVLYCGGVPVFADVDPDTLLLDPDSARAALTPRTRVLAGVDYAGQPCDWPALRALAETNGLSTLADSCHALGAALGQTRAGTFADVNIFSFHPVKSITTGEGGMVLTDQPRLADLARRFRNHGITTTVREREHDGLWRYDMETLGFNYRLSDIQCALGLSQLGKLDAFLARREEIAARYDAAFSGTPVQPLAVRAGLVHARHLYVVRIAGRDRVFKAMRRRGFGVQVHYLPVYRHSYYRRRFGDLSGSCPMAERVFPSILTLPLHPSLTDDDVDAVIRGLLDCLA